MANAGYIFTNGMPRARQVQPRTRAEYLREKLYERPETAQMQRVKTLTRDERALSAIDRMTADEMHDSHGVRSEEAVRKDMSEIARVAELKRDERRKK